MKDVGRDSEDDGKIAVCPDKMQPLATIEALGADFLGSIEGRRFHFV
jgi:hypothetical protein